MGYHPVQSFAHGQSIPEFRQLGGQRCGVGAGPQGSENFLGPFHPAQGFGVFPQLVFNPSQLPARGSNVQFFFAICRETE